MMRLVGTFLMVALAVPALAQDGSDAVMQRSPEGARKFLSQILTTGNAGAASKVNGYWNKYTYDNGRDESSRDGDHNPIRELKFDSDCFATIKTEDIVAYKSRSGSFSGQLNVGSLYIDFKVFAKAEANDTLVYLRGLGASYRLSLPSEEVAKRVAVAMDFLRQSCDTTENTGF